MSSPSPRTRIDQFFTARKKKPLSPCAKAEKTEKDSKSALDGSPSSKSTLDSFLANSHQNNCLVKSPLEDHGSILKHDPVKRNLALEINLASDVTQKSLSSLSNSESQDDSVDVGVIGGVQQAALSKISDKVISSHQCNIVAKDSVEVSDLATRGYGEETITSSSGEQKLQLRQFAADFLSLYCGELPPNLNSLPEQKLHGQKRSGSPSLLVDNCKMCKKKQCVSDCCWPQPEVDKTCLNLECPEKMVAGLRSRAEEAILEEIGGKGGKEYDGDKTEVYPRLRKCNQVSSSSLSVVGCCTTTGQSTNDACTRETPKSLQRCSIFSYGDAAQKTPKSLQRSSIFSPGDAFWNEAIEVVDGLFAPVDAVSVQVIKGINHSKGQNGRVAGSGSESVEDNNECRHLSLRTAVESVLNHHIDNARLPSVDMHKDVSPLPVRHFDFSFEENNLDGSAQQHDLITIKDICHLGNGFPECSSVNRRGSQSSIIPTCCESLTDQKHNSEGKPKSSCPIPLNMDHNASHLAMADNEGRFQASGTARTYGDKGIVLGTTSDVLENEVNGSSVACHILNEADTPSSVRPTGFLQLSNWLSSEICNIYMKKGISKLYPWQVDCLQVDGVLQKRNLVYCASTSAGKSFVAEILMLRQVISTGKMALLVLPYVSICTEKAEHLEGLIEPLGKHVRSFYGNQGGGTLPKDTSIAVCTIEKANSLVNRLLEEGRLSEVGIIVIDELHMVGEHNRGYLLELLLTKLRYAAGEGSTESSSGDSSSSSSGRSGPAYGLQIVGMSATMPNVAAVADWLQAALYQTDFRPVPLEEFFKVGNTIFNKKMDLVWTIPKSSDLGGKDPDHIVELCNEVVQEGHSVLIFCSSRKGCESTARHVAKFLKEFSACARDDASEFSDVSSAIDALRRCPAGLDPILEETLPSGVAYHHAGLTVEEREIVETCYRRGIVRVLTATSTLAAGVNLPARRVIFRQPRIGRDFIDGIRYRQMAGRAGRTGIDTRGESILICKPEEVKRIMAMLNDSCPPLQSCLSEDKNGMTHAILEVVAGGIVQTASDIHRYVRCTLLNSTKPFNEVVKSAQDSLRWLCHRKFLEWNGETNLYSITPLGRAAFGSSLCPEESLVVLDDLSRAREGFVLASDLHLVYLVTPINVDVEPDWEIYYERFMELSALDRSVGNRVGVVEPFLMRMAHGAPLHIHNRSRGDKKGLHGRSQSRNSATNSSVLSDEQTLRVCRRFYVALMLSRLVQEVPIADVCEAFKVARGMVQALQENAGRFALMVSLFCERLGWHDLEGLVAKFQNRVSFGVRAEIAELTTIPYVKGSRARALYKAGLRTPLSIAESSIPDIVKALFEYSFSWAPQEGSTERHIQMAVAKKIKNGARKIVLDQAEEARVAAFSTFKSLGILVPQLSQPLLSSAVSKPVMQKVVMTSGETNASSSDVVKPKNDAQLKSKLPLEENKLDHRVEKFTITSKADLGNAEEVKLDGALLYNCNGYTTEVLGEGSAPTNGPETCLTINSTEKSPSRNLANVSNSNVMPGKVVDHEKQEGNHGENISNRSSGSIFDRGPINASNMPGGFDSFLDLWDAVREFYFDVHFTRRSEKNSPILFEIHGFAICWENSPVYYVNLSKDLVSSQKLNLTSSNDFCGNEAEDENKPVTSKFLWEIAKSRWKRINMIMKRIDVRKVTWDLKIQIQVLQIPGIPIHRFGRFSFEYKETDDIQLIDSSYLLLPSISVKDGIDMRIAAWILWPDEESSCRPNLDKEVKMRLSAEAVAAANRDGRWRNQTRRAAHNGCCRRVAQIRALSSVLWKLVASEDLICALTKIEYPLVKVLADMEIWGIGIDMEACLRARHVLGKKLKELEKEACSLAGKTFSLYTSADIAHVLYQHLKLPIPEGKNKGKQHPSTDKHSLDLLRHQHPIVSVIKEHRTLAKLLNSTLGSICSQARLRSEKYTIHGHWLQTSTATGRLSMEEPNLQCVEHTVDFTIHHIDKNTASSDTNHHQINARDFFIPTQDNWLLITADYSQIELRLMAHFSKDSSLIDLLSKPDGDAFTMMAARWTGQQESAIISQEREQTKKLVYGILYGMGANTLAEQLDCSSNEAAEKIKSFKSSFPGVSAWLSESVASCRQKGFIETLKGRKRFLSKIKIGSSREKAKAQRQAVNSICQGSAADIIKIAMINIHTVIVEGCGTLDSNIAWATNFSSLKGNCQILLQVHDELLLEVHPSLVKEAGLLLKLSMENAVSLNVPLRVKLKVGRTWGSLEPFDIDFHKEQSLLRHS